MINYHQNNREGNKMRLLDWTRRGVLAAAGAGIVALGVAGPGFAQTPPGVLVVGHYAEPFFKKQGQGTGGIRPVLDCQLHGLCNYSKNEPDVFKWGFFLLPTANRFTVYIYWKIDSV